jgi:hypothetical protein
MSYEDPIVISASSAKTASGNSALFSCPAGARVSVWVNVSAVSGTTPSMTLTVQWSMDGTNWADGDPADTFTAVTAVGAKVKDFARKASLMRLVWTISGTTPSFTLEARAQVSGS